MGLLYFQPIEVWRKGPPVMNFKAGDIVTLRSGGMPMTVLAAEGGSVECIWLGDDGDLFRHAIPALALVPVTGDEDEEGSGRADDGEDTEDEGEDEDAGN
jgi:uncharacterized protein YodC (DUF2158 family)